VIDKQPISRNGVGSVSGVMKRIGLLMKKLIVSGCSFTDKNFISISHPDIDFSFKKWPELLAEKLNMECINLAKSGQGNEYISSSLQDEIVRTKDKSNIGLVIAAWSQAPRKDYKEGTYWSSIRVNPFGNLSFWVEKTLRFYMNFQIMCERFNIPYAQFQMIELFEHFLNGILPSEKEVLIEGKNPNIRAKYPGNTIKDEKKILNSIIEYDTLLDTSKFIGWPVARKLGGYIMQDKIDLLKNENSNLRISKSDKHPNEKGHNILAKTIYLQLKKIIEDTNE
jgi:hypothetical protein